MGKNELSFSFPTDRPPVGRSNITGVGWNQELGTSRVCVKETVFYVRGREGPRSLLGGPTLITPI